MLTSISQPPNEKLLPYLGPLYSRLSHHPHQHPICLLYRYDLHSNREALNSKITPHPYRDYPLSISHCRIHTPTSIFQFQPTFNPRVYRVLESRFSICLADVRYVRRGISNVQNSLGRSIRLEIW